MGETVGERGEFRKKAFASQLQKSQPGKAEGVCSRAPGRLSKGDGEGVRLQRNGYLSGNETPENYPKKKTMGYREQDEKKVAAYQAEISAYPVENIAYVDECGIDTYLYRAYGYAARGQKVFDQISGRKYRRCGIVAARLNGKILAPLRYDGTMDSSLFEFWFTSQLLPTLEKGCVVVMDNASFHRKARLFSAAQNAGIILIFLPPYSPELNPIEHFWAWLKRYLSNILPFSPSFDDALFDAFQLW